MKPFPNHGRKLEILNSPLHREYPVSIHIWIAVRAGDREYAHSRKLGASVMNSIRSARAVQNDILAIAGSEEKAAVHLPSRLIGRLRGNETQ
jgi:hypothetical protein